MPAWILNLLSLLQLCPFSLQDLSASDIEFWNIIARNNIDRKLRENPHLLEVKRPKNIILFIGDGMGIATVTSARINKNQEAGNKYLNEPLYFEKFTTAGLVKTSSFSNHVTDSAASATALYTGRKIDNTFLNLKPQSNVMCTDQENLKIKDGIVEGALRKGVDVGFVTTTRITHATPGALYAKGIHRNIEYDGEAIERGVPNCTDIAKQLLSYPANEFKVLMGGGRRNLRDKSRGGLRKDGRSIDIEWSNLGGNRKVLTSTAGLRAHEANGEKLLGLFAESHFPFFLEEKLKNETRVPRLSEMTVKAIQQLQGGEHGFFLMVEGGNIDTAEHNNQMHLAFGELYEFEEAIKKAREMTNRSETLIIVTADHGHAVTLPGYLPANKTILSSQVVTSEDFDKKSTEGKEKTKAKTTFYEVPGIFFATGPGFRGGFEVESMNLDEEKRAHPLYRLPTAIPMQYGVHGGEDVGIWADGPFAQLFTSTLENTEVAYIIKFLLCTSTTDYTFCDIPKLSETPQPSVFVKNIVETVGEENLVTLGICLLGVAILSLMTTVTLSVMLILQRRRCNSLLHIPGCTSETTLVKTSI
ncbi:unnamed protein product [Cylicocyclus nassatus]|uniref:Alkaline phosphatase n=1 Tax=Cylicocyclus nassatus TaxID=53992 RepID=A0AA36MAE9_CYLNA|nr:unnamed protein product [Cylicocyclus nassatus]